MFLHWVILFSVLIAGCKQGTGISDRPIAILGAFADEIHMLEDSLKNKQIIEQGGIIFTRGLLKGKDVVLAYTGIGKVNAAMTTSLLIDHFNPSITIFTGIAGGLNPDLNPADIVVAGKSVQHDLNYVYDDSLVSYPVSSPVTGKVNPVFYKSDSMLLHILEESYSGIELKSYKTGNREYKPKIIMGIIATGDAFIASDKKKAELIRRFHADAVEMEGAAVAQICYQYNIPIIIIRSISDSADENAGVDIEKFLNVSSENANRVVIKLVESLP